MTAPVPLHGFATHPRFARYGLFLGFPDSFETYAAPESIMPKVETTWSLTPISNEIAVRCPWANYTYKGWFWNYKSTRTGSVPSYFRVSKGTWISPALIVVPGVLNTATVSLFIMGGIQGRSLFHPVMDIPPGVALAPVGTAIKPGPFLFGSDPGGNKRVQTFRAYMYGLAGDVYAYGGWFRGRTWVEYGAGGSGPQIQFAANVFPPGQWYSWRMSAYYDRLAIPFTPENLAQFARDTLFTGADTGLMFCQNADIRNCVVTPASGIPLRRDQHIFIEATAGIGRELETFEIDGVNYLNRQEYEYPAIQTGNLVDGELIAQVDPARLPLEHYNFAPGSQNISPPKASNRTSRKFLYGPVTKSFCIRAHATDIIIGTITAPAGDVFTATARTDECCSTTWSIVDAGPFTDVSINAQGVVTGTIPRALSGRQTILIRLTNPFLSIVGVLVINVLPWVPTGLRWEIVTRLGTGIISFAQDPVTRRIFMGTADNRVFSTLDLVAFTEIGFAPTNTVAPSGGIQDMVCLSDGTLIILSSNRALYTSATGSALAQRLQIPETNLFVSAHRLGLISDSLLYVGNGHALVSPDARIALINLADRNNFVHVRQAWMARPTGTNGRVQMILPVSATEALIACSQTGAVYVNRTIDQIATSPVPNTYWLPGDPGNWSCSMFRHDNGVYYLAENVQPPHGSMKIHTSANGISWVLAHTLSYSSGNMVYVGQNIAVVFRDHDTNISQVTNFTTITPARLLAAGGAESPLVTDGHVRRIFQLRNNWLLAGTSGATTNLYVSRS